MRKRIAYSQNFLRDKGLITQLIDKSSLNKEDTVLEIGAGQGIITNELLKQCRSVIAFEIDRNLFNKLSQRFQDDKTLELRFGDFLFHNLPNQPYKVFSNIPFNITSAVIKKLTQASCPPEDAYLIIQKEAAKKFVGKPYDNKNSQTAILTKPWFDMEFSYEFQRSDFFPKPNVDTVLLRIEKKSDQLIDRDNKRQYEDFVSYAFNQFKPNIGESLSEIFGKQKINNLAQKLNIRATSKPIELDFRDWLSLFKMFRDEIDYNHQRIVNDSYSKLVEQQSHLQKIHRTRTDRRWRNLVSNN